MRDTIGAEIKKGNIVVHASRKGSNMWLEPREVVEAGPDFIKVTSLYGGIKTRLTAPNPYRTFSLSATHPNPRHPYVAVVAKTRAAYRKKTDSVI